MGKITLDGQVLSEPLSSPSLLELIALIEDKYIKDGWIVVEVNLDGDSLSEFTFADGTLIPYDPESELEIKSRQLEDIMVTSIREFIKYLERLIPGLGEVARLFRENLVDEANNLYIEAIDGIRVMIELIQGISSSNIINFEASKFNGRSLMEMTTTLKESVEALVQAQADGDNAGLADILEKGLTSILTEWYETLPALINEIDAG